MDCFRILTATATLACILMTWVRSLRGRLARRLLGALLAPRRPRSAKLRTMWVTALWSSASSSPSRQPKCLQPWGGPTGPPHVYFRYAIVPFPPVLALGGSGESAILLAKFH